MLSNIFADLSIQEGGRLCDKRPMEDEIIDYIIEEMDRQEKTASELARYMGVDPAQITRLLGHRRKDGAKRGRKKTVETKPKGFLVKEFVKIMEFLGTPLSRDILVAKRKLYVKFAPFRGTIAHGVWREKNMPSIAKYKDIPYLPVSEWGHLEQYAYQVIDAHALQYAKEGSFILCVEYAKARDEPKNDDIVVIERHIKLPAAKKNVEVSEMALRRIVIDNGKCILRSLSDNPDVDDIQYDPADKTVRISDLVLGNFSLSPNVSY